MLDCKKILTENFCYSGETDLNGIYRYTNQGNVLYIVTSKSGGWAFSSCNRNGTMIRKHSIRNDGSMKNCGKIYKSDLDEVALLLQKAKKYAILTPKTEYMYHKQGIYSDEDMLVWVNV